MWQKGIQLAVLAGAIGIMTGCSVSYEIKKPITTSLETTNDYQDTLKIQLVDLRTDTAFHEKISTLKQLKVNLDSIGDEIEFLKNNLNAEFASKRIPLSVYTNENSPAIGTKLEIQVYKITSYRISSYTPWEAYHQFEGRLIRTQGDTIAIRAYFFNGKVPIMSMKEVEEPCFNMPISILTKEIAAKLNRFTVGSKVTPSNIDSLSKFIRHELGKKDDGPFYEVLALGCSNNELARPILKELCATSDRFLRACALSAIGIIGAENEFDFLKRQFERYSEIDKYMALKSIGDINTQDSESFVRQMRTHLLYKRENGFKYCVELYAKDIQ